MDSIFGIDAFGMVTGILLIHFAIGVAFARVPSLRNLYVGSAAKYAEAAMKMAYWARTGPAKRDKAFQDECDALARTCIEIAEEVLRYRTEHAPKFVDFLWISQLGQSLDYLRRADQLHAACRPRAT